jgi:hypothetical protein
LAARWAGRVTAGVLFLMAGAFFLEHMQEWFLRGDGQYPSAWVWVKQVFHLGVLVGLAMTWRWEKAGSVVLAVSAVGFFAGLGWQPLAIGLVCVTPVAFYAAAWMLERRRPVTG